MTIYSHIITFHKRLEIVSYCYFQFLLELFTYKRSSITLSFDLAAQ